jgi:hypothetical protein
MDAREAQTANAVQSASNVSTGSPLNFGELMQSLRPEETFRYPQILQITQSRGKPTLTASATGRE